MCQWLGDLSIYLKDLIFVLEVDSLTTGFGLVTFHTPQAAYDAWQKLHKAPIVGKRFVEVFALFPPHCPLSRRADTMGSTTTSNGRTAPELAPSSPPTSNVDNTVAGSGNNGGLIPDPHQQCRFCGFSYWQHGDHGVAAFATLRLRRLMDTGIIAHSPGLMHTAFLKVPALLFQDAGAVSRHEVETFDPDLWHEKRGESLLSEPGVVSLDALEKNNSGIWTDRSSTFFDLLQVESYHMRILISEVANILMTYQNELQKQRCHLGPSNFTADRNSNIRKQPPGTLSIADIGNRLSTRARAYLFLTETKLKNVLETFEEFFILSEPIGPYPFYSVSLTPQLLSKGSMLIWNLQPYQLSRRGRRRDPNRKATSGEVLSLQPLERRSTQIASTQIAYGHSAANSVVPSASPNLPPLLSLSRATSCAVSRVPDSDADASFNLSPSIRHQRLRTPPTPMILDTYPENVNQDIFCASGFNLPAQPTSEEPLSQVLVDFIKSAGLESIMSADSTASSSRRLSQWTTGVPPGLEDVPPLCSALTPASRSRTCPGCRQDFSANSCNNNSRQVASPVARGHTRPSWLLVSQAASERLPMMDPVLERQQLISNLLKERDEVEAKIEEALNCPTPLPALQHPDQNSCMPHVSKGLGTFANDLMPVDNFPLMYDPNGDEIIEPSCTDLTFDHLDDFLLNERVQNIRRSHELGTGPPPPPPPSSHMASSSSRLTPIEVSELLRALDR